MALWAPRIVRDQVRALRTSTTTSASSSSSIATTPSLDLALWVLRCAPRAARRELPKPPRALLLALALLIERPCSCDFVRWSLCRSSTSTWVPSPPICSSSNFSPSLWHPTYRSNPFQWRRTTRFASSCPSTLASVSPFHVRLAFPLRRAARIPNPTTRSLGHSKPPKKQSVPVESSDHIRVGCAASGDHLHLRRQMGALAHEVGVALGPLSVHGR